uniref:Uncharacterized protein n=1 Tax=Glossina pallidipes TaxID=7398 RepID=A0A1A9Z8P0_GLOPL
MYIEQLQISNQPDSCWWLFSGPVASDWTSLLSCGLVSGCEFVLRVLCHQCLGHCLKRCRHHHSIVGFEDDHLSGILLVYEDKRLFEQQKMCCYYRHSDHRSYESQLELLIFIYFVIKAIPLFTAFNQRRIRHCDRRPLYTLNNAISQSIARSNRTIWQIAAMLENETRRTLNYLSIPLVNYCTDHSGLVQSSSLIASTCPFY